MNFGKILKAFAIALEDFQAYVVKLINEAIPGLSDELLTEWEEELGLPDECGGYAITKEERAAAAHAKYYAKYDGQSKQFYIDYVDNLGGIITIEDYSGSSSLFRVDKSRVDRTPLEGIDGARLRSKTSAFKWIVHVYDTGNVSMNYLQCIFEKMKPAHTVIIWDDLT